MPVALVTGASRGIGRATALALGNSGFSVGVLSRTAGALDETCDLLRERGVSVASAVADVGDEVQVLQAVDVIEAGLGEAVAVLVNNAGSMLAIGPAWEVDPRDWWEDVRSSLGGTFTCCRVVVPRLIDRGGGRIVNLTSYAAARPAPYQSAYAAAKAGVASFTEALAAEVRQHGIHVHAVAPGFTETAMTRALLDSPRARRWLPGSGTGGALDVELTTRLIVRLATGDGDALSGRMLHSLDDLDTLAASIDEIERDDLYVLRLRRLAAGAGDESS